MGLTEAMGKRVWRLLRSRSTAESAGFWVALILSYLALSFLAGARGVGYTERFDEASRSIAFDLNPFLWFPDVFLHAYPPTNPVPFLLWWVALAALIAEVLMVAMRVLRGGAHGENTGTVAHRSRSA
jgi:hypothetical protein